MNFSQTGQGVPLMLMTADEKINELQQILESKNIENDDMRVIMQKGGSASKLPQQEIQH